MTLLAKPAKVRTVVALTSSTRTGQTSREDIVGHVSGVDATAELDSTAIEAESRHLQVNRSALPQVLSYSRPQTLRDITMSHLFGVGASGNRAISTTISSCVTVHSGPRNQSKTFPCHLAVARLIGAIRTVE